MLQEGDEPQEGSRKSIIACHSCRKRKVKCDREYPSCQVCEQTGQDCNYPLKPKKPGPKIGSLQRHKRRYQERQMQQNGDQPLSRKSTSPPGPADEDLDMHSAIDLDGEDSDSQMGNVRNPEWTTKRRNSKLNINSLSFILHPSHEASTPEKDSSSTTKDTPEHEKQGMIQQACLMLGLSQEMARFMVRVYFNNMVAINLFHEPTFNETVANFANPVHICALVAAMCSFSAKFYAADLESAAPGVAADLLRAEAETHSPDRFIAMALKFVDEALVECDDEPPPICLVQALIITTHCQLTKGVHGKAWRLLGMCVRLAYELNLHLVDALEPVREGGGSGRPDPIRWRDAEEKRRAWWAVWEMDVFASTVRRTPTAIDWAHMETLLPVDDADWFRNEPAPSTFMEPDPVQRWKVLQETGNHSPKAWYLVINSLMKDAQIISSPRGVPFQPDLDQRRRAKSLCRKTKRLSSTSAGPSPIEEARQRLAMLANSVQCFVLALPQHLRYRNQYLGFDPPVPGQVVSVRQLHCGIYNIYVMTQLARLMIHRYDMFGTHAASRQAGHAGQLQQMGDGGLQLQRSPGFQDPDDPCVRQYFEAADNILMVVNRSCEDHIQHINPFLPSTIWLAAAVQLVRKYIGGPGINQGLIKSRFDVLYLTYKRCVEFWDTKTAMEQNLESLEMQLEGQQPSRTGGGKESSARQEARASSSGKERPADLGPPPSRERSSKRVAGADEQASVDRGPEEKPRISSRSKEQTSHNPARTLPDTAETPPLPQFVPNSPPATVIVDQQHVNSMTTSTSRAEYLRHHVTPLGAGEGTESAIPMLDFMHMAMRGGDARLMMGASASTPTAGGTAPSVPSSMMSAAFFDSQGLSGMDLQHELDWRNLELPIDIHDALSGLTTY